jgi:cyclopropane fatty-acyl-phospholipid synthase-like methyltransferase
VSLDWYQTFFRGVAVDVWRRAVSPQQTRLDVEFLQKHLELAPGKRVLDVPCGLGRHSLELASRGCRVSGVDLSEESVDEARDAAASRGLDVDFRYADMRELPWTGEFDAAFCFGNSFGYLDPAGTDRFVEALSRSLKPGGRFALQTGIAAESVLPNLRPHDETQIGDVLFIEDNRYDPWESRVETMYTFVRGENRESRLAFHWIYSVRELRSLFTSHGLNATAAFSSRDGEPYRAGAYELYLVARKT